MRLLSARLAAATLAADTDPRQPGVDVLHYTFRLSFSDASNQLEGEASIDLRYLEDNVGEVIFDLAGMTVTGVTPGSHTHSDGRLRITSAPSKKGERRKYYRNMSKLDHGQMVLMDFAPDYRYYTSDVTRMWPVSGKYSPPQRELLQFVLDYRNAILKRIRPGVTAQQIMDEAKVAMEPVFARTKFPKPADERAARELVERGGGVFSHPVGAQAGTCLFDRSATAGSRRDAVYPL